MAVLCAKEASNNHPYTVLIWYRFIPTVTQQTDNIMIRFLEDGRVLDRHPGLEENRALDAGDRRASCEFQPLEDANDTIRND